MTETVWKCNICKDGKVYTSRERLKHEVDMFRKKGIKHNSWEMVKKEGK